MLYFRKLFDVKIIDEKDERGHQLLLPLQVVQRQLVALVESSQGKSQPPACRGHKQSAGGGHSPTIRLPTSKPLTHAGLTCEPQQVAPPTGELLVGAGLANSGACGGSVRP